MTTTESTPVYYQIRAPGLDYHRSGTIFPNTRNVIRNLTDKMNTFPTNIFDDIPQGIYLNVSSDNVAVKVQSGEQDATDPFLALPIRFLNTHEYVYYPFSLAPTAVADGLVAIVATSDDTTITFKVTVDSKISFNGSMGWIVLGAEEEQAYVINRLQTVYMSASLTDFTGSKIVADKPLSVISSHKCVFVQSQSEACDDFISQVPPTAVWGTTYYITPFSNRNSYTLRIIATYERTRVQVTCNGMQRNVLIDDGKSFQQIYSNQEFCAVHSNKKISVVQSSYGPSEVGLGDSIRTLVAAVNDYSNEISISTNGHVKDLSYKQYVCNVLVTSEYYQPELIYLNDGGINQTLEYHDWVPIVVDNVTEAYATQVYLDDAVEIFQISHVNNAALMSAVTYGVTVDLTPQRVHSRAVTTNPAGGFSIFDLSRSKIACTVYVRRYNRNVKFDQVCENLSAHPIHTLKEPNFFVEYAVKKSHHYGPMLCVKLYSYVLSKLSYGIRNYSMTCFGRLKLP